MFYIKLVNIYDFKNFYIYLWIKIKNYLLFSIYYKNYQKSGFFKGLVTVVIVNI